MNISVFKRAPHPSYSPDLVPSEFFLFGYHKEKLNGHLFETREQLYEAIRTFIDTQLDEMFLKNGWFVTNGYIHMMEHNSKNKSSH